MADLYAVIGNPISQSKSPAIHASFARQTHQDIEYELLPCKPGEFIEIVNNFRNRNGKGLNVTLPFKQKAFHYADELSEEARAAGAVNTLWFREDGTCCGHNTDGIGFINDLKKHDITLKNKTVLLLGAGGAARGVLLPLLRENPEEIVIVNRTMEKAERLIEQTSLFLDPGSSLCAAIGYAELVRDDNNRNTKPFDIIINATSASLQNINLPLPENIIAKHTACYDMVYQNGLTCFLQWAKKADAAILLDGKGMLLEQAAESFYLWRGIKPTIE